MEEEEEASDRNVIIEKWSARALQRLSLFINDEWSVLWVGGLVRESPVLFNASSSSSSSLPLLLISVSVTL